MLRRYSVGWRSMMASVPLHQSTSGLLQGTSHYTIHITHIIYPFTFTFPASKDTYLSHIYRPVSLFTLFSVQRHFLPCHFIQLVAIIFSTLPSVCFLTQVQARIFFAAVQLIIIQFSPSFFQQKVQRSYPRVQNFHNI